VSNSTESVLKRRAFLAAAAGGAAAVAVPGIAAATASRPHATASLPHAATASRPHAVQSPGAGLGARSSGPAPGDWTALGKDLAGTLVRPGDRGYPTARLLFDPRFDSLRPAGIAYVKNPHDVSTCLAFVRKFGIQFAVRSGGHSYAGWSGSNGLIIDVTHLRGLSVSGSSVTVGTGIRLVDFYNGLAAKGRAVPGGSCPTVGIAGLTLGGGIGVFARAWGLTSDNLSAMQIVTADGAVRTASKTENPDLFWACRGGGGGNFGVATQFTFVSHPAPTPVIFFLSWPWSQAAKVVAAWQSWAPHAPDALWSNLHLGAAPGGSTPTIRVGGTYLGSISGAASLLSQLYAKAGSHPAGYYLNQVSYLDAMLVEAGCASIGYQACHLPWYAPGGQLTRQPQYAKSDFFTTPLSSAGIGTLLAGIMALQQVKGAIGGVGGIAFDSLGGALNRVKPNSTAFVHRNALFGAQYTTDWTNGAASSGIASQYTWLQKYWGSMRRYASGQAYQNYVDPALKNWRVAYYGANYDELVRIKKKYDPARLFTFPQAIGTLSPAAPAGGGRSGKPGSRARSRRRRARLQGRRCQVIASPPVTPGARP
jgi:FAD/FMN-containing dehydrogenase